MEFIKKSWKYVLTAVLALVIGAAAGASTRPTPEELAKAKSESKQLQKQVETQADSVKQLLEENEQFSAKLVEAEPYFAMTEQERLNKEKEVELKEQELKKKEEARIAEAERLAKEKAEKEAAAALAARSKTLSTGAYVVGRDIDAGLYNVVAASGNGNVAIWDSGQTDLKVNEMIGTRGEHYTPSFSNVDLVDGDTIDVQGGLSVHFEPLE